MSKLTKEDIYPLASLKKLEEARILLHESIGHLDRKFFWSEILFHAFVSSAWSVTKYLQKELSNLDEEKITTGAREWYEKAITAIFYLPLIVMLGIAMLIEGVKRMKNETVNE